MSDVDAVYRRGVFEPLAPVALQENQRVRLSIQPIVVNGAASWLKMVQDIQQDIIRRAGLMPDSSVDIAADRLR